MRYSGITMWGISLAGSTMGRESAAEALKKEEKEEGKEEEEEEEEEEEDDADDEKAALACSPRLQCRLGRINNVEENPSRIE
jgi:hypothetical protein